MSVGQINDKLAAGLTISICPWDLAWTNAASATVLSVDAERRVTYRVEDCESTVTRTVSYGTWRQIVEQAK